MSQCAIDVERSERFKQEFQALQKKYPRTIDDVSDLFRRISENPRGAAKGERHQLGTDQEVYKYDCKCTDLQRGSNKGYRIIALYEPSQNLVTPLAMYLKPANIEDREIAVAMAALKAPSSGPTALARRPGQSSSASPPTAS